MKESAATSLNKGMKQLLGMVSIMICGLGLALTTSKGSRFCPDQKVSRLYQSFFFRSVDLEKLKDSRPPIVNARRGFLDDGDIVKSQLVKENNTIILVLSKNSKGDKGGPNTVDLGKAKDANALGSNLIEHFADDRHFPTSECDYSRGKWVKDNNRSSYSGEACKPWLSEMWACRLMNRPDFNYENYRWQPDGCDLPNFDGLTFLSRMKNKVLAFVGDSIGRQQYQSMLCLITSRREDLAVEDVSLEYGFFKPPGAVRAEGTAQRFKITNTTIIFHWSVTLCEIDPLNKGKNDTEYAMHLDRPAAFLQKYIHKLDVLVLNTGHHWNRGKVTENKWIMHVNGKPNNDRNLIVMKDIYTFAVHRVVAWLHQQMERKHTRAQIYMRSLSPRHFYSGEWNSGGRCDDNRFPVERKNITGKMTRDLVTERAILGTRIRLLNVTYLSQFRDEAHISKYKSKQGGQDCLHWCLPGVPDIWNEVLYADLFFRNSSQQDLTDVTKASSQLVTS